MAHSKLDDGRERQFHPPIQTASGLHARDNKAWKTHAHARNSDMFSARSSHRVSSDSRVRASILLVGLPLADWRLLCIPPIWSYSDLTSLQVFPILVLIVSLFVSGQEKYGFEVSIVVNGVKIVYVPLLPGHSKRLDQKWVNLVYFQLRHGKMKQFPSCCQSENKEIQVPLGWPTVGQLFTDEQMGW